MNSEFATCTETAPTPKAFQPDLKDTSILVVAPSWVGDTVMAQPMFRRLHERFPQLKLDVLATPWTLPLLRRMPEVNQVLINPFKHGEFKLLDRIALGRELRRHHYSQAIVLPNSLKSALPAFFARIPIRTGFIGEMRRGFLNDARHLDARALPLMVERFALLAEAAGEPLQRPLAQPRLTSDDNHRRATLSSLGLTLDRPAIAFCPGAEYGPAKRWPAEHFGALAKQLAPNYDVWIVGSAKEQGLAQIIQAVSGGICRDLCGRTSLDEAIDVLASAASVVTNDSGLMHVASAVGTPVIALYGSSSPEFTPPLSQKAHIVRLGVPCSPCYKRECPLGHFKCMRDIEPNAVYADVSRQVAQVSAR